MHSSHMLQAVEWRRALSNTKKFSNLTLAEIFFYLGVASELNPTKQQSRYYIYIFIFWINFAFIRKVTFPPVYLQTPFSG